MKETLCLTQSLLLLPWFALHSASLAALTWATTMREVMKPSGSPMLRTRLLTERVKTLRPQSSQWPTPQDRQGWMKQPPVRQKIGE